MHPPSTSSTAAYSRPTSPHTLRYSLCITDMLADPSLKSSLPSDGLKIASAICLLAWMVYTFAKLLIYFWQGWVKSSGNIRLPDEGAVEEKTTRKQVFYKQLMSYMAADLQEDGEPVDEQGFWRALRLPRLLIMTVASALFGFRIYRDISLSHFARQAGTDLDLAVETIAVSLILVLACLTIFTHSVQTYGALLHSMFGTAALLTIHCYVRIVSLYIAPNLISEGLTPDLIALGIAATATIVIGTTPREPGRYRDRTRVYNEAVAEKLKQTGGERFEANILASGRSILGQFLSSYMFAVVFFVVGKDQVDLHELPVLAADMQTESRAQKSLGRDRSSQHGAHGSTASLMWATLWSQREVWLKSNFCLLVERGLAYAPYYCLNRILAALDGDKNSGSIWVYASLYIVVLKANNFTSVYRLWDLSLFRLHLGLRTHLIYLLFRKLLTRNLFSSAGGKSTSDNKVLAKPDILNLLSTDVAHLETAVWTVGSVIELILSLIIGCAFMWSLLGVSAAWGIAFSFLTYPPAYLLSKWELRLFDKSRSAGDARVSAIQETVQTISMVKMSGYERHTFDRLNSLRQKEFKYQFWARVIGFVSAALYSAAPALVVLISFGHYTLFAHHRLTASVAFTSIAVFAELRPALTLAPKYLADLFKAFVAMRRIQTFLCTYDVEYLEATADQSSFDTNAVDAPLMVQGDVTWNRSDEINAPDEPTVFTLRGLNLAFPRGEISLIAGKAGAGKSLVLLALLGEVTLLQGKIGYALSPMLDPEEVDSTIDWSVLGTGVAYVPQTAWLQSMSIRDNILFGLPMKTERYKKVLHACALLPDLEVLEDSDLTEIGERGKTLSGGQKARVSLARAMYSRASVIVLDDVLSAVDASTCQHIIKHCFVEPMIPGRTVIIASHAVEPLAPISKRAFFLGDGTCLWQGTGLELLDTDHMSHLRSDKQTSSTLEIDSTAQTTVEEGSGDPNAERARKHSLDDTPTDFEIRMAPAKTPRQMLVDEKRMHGTVEGRYWLELIRMCGGRLFLGTFITLTLGSVLGPVAERALVESWTGGTTELEPRTWIIAYTALSTTVIALSVAQELAGFWGGFQAMKTTYVHMLDRVLRSPMQFFVKTRAGSIVQRFSGDLDAVVDCAEVVGGTTLAVSEVIISLASITWFAGWRFAATVVLLVLFYWRPAQWYRTSSRQVRRLLSILPGPVNAHFGETIVGAPVIRAFGVQGLHVKQMLRLFNMHMSSQILSWMIGRWNWVCTELFDLVIIATAFSLVLTTPDMTGAKAGFIIGFAVNITNEFNTLLVYLREWDLKGVTLERLAEYRNLDTEGIPTFIEDEGDDTDASPGSLLYDHEWPRAGKIEVSGLHARYAPDLPDVLKDVSFTVESGQRIGIVGATGCGKSTLAKALFSFVDVTGGSIRVDGTDLRDLPLDIARGRLGIIGQDPMLVTGSLRLNLDVEGVHSDDDLYAVLHRISLLDKTVQARDTSGTDTETSSVTAVGEGAGGPKNRNVFEDLDYEIVGAGDNLSAGEKQLVVLARALLQRKKVLIMDEATASIDTKTDLIITKLVHEEFGGSTVLIIAHRLRTIMPCDRIMVMDKGRIVQFDTPRKLLDLGRGAFYNLCMAAGAEEFEQLSGLARA